MALEIEHKFLINNENWKNDIYKSTIYKQGYLHSDKTTSIRVRATDIEAWINIKSATIGTQRHEYEYSIPVDEANEILDLLCKKPFIEKTRHLVKHKQHIWEIDIFTGDNSGLIVAEIELKKVGEPFEKPEWLGEEVTDDLRYYNNRLINHPYKLWINK